MSNESRKEECARMVREWAEHVDFVVKHEELLGPGAGQLIRDGIESLKERIIWLEKYIAH